MPETNNQPKTCGTCRFWNFKVSTDKAWGRCLNPKVRETSYVSVHIPMDCESVEAGHKFMKDVAENCEVYYEKNGFGCILYG